MLYGVLLVSAVCEGQPGGGGDDPGRLPGLHRLTCQHDEHVGLQAGKFLGLLCSVLMYGHASVCCLQWLCILSVNLLHYDKLNLNYYSTVIMKRFQNGIHMMFFNNCFCSGGQ